MERKFLNEKWFLDLKSFLSEYCIVIKNKCVISIHGLIKNEVEFTKVTKKK